MIAVAGDPLQEVTQLERATFVMKGGAAIEMKGGAAVEGDY